MTSEHLISRLKRIDWDFSGSYSDSPFSSLHWHPARFASQIPGAVIGLLSDVGDVVLDPFAGSGTTAIEAQRLGRRSIAVDVHPLSCRMTKAKTLAFDAVRIGRTLDSITSDVQEALGYKFAFSERIKKVTPITPESVQIAKWYNARVGADLSRVWGLISTYRGSKRALAEVVFSSILLPVCRETRHWGFVCDNTEPRGTHGADVAAEFQAVCERFKAAYLSRDKELRRRFKGKLQLCAVDVINKDARTGLASLKPGCVDLVVTSPPYFGVCDYVKAQRLSMEWFGYNIEDYRLLEIGARSKRHRRAAFEEYLGELQSVFQAVYKCLSSSGWMVIVVGESSARRPFLDDLIAILKSIGFKMEIKRSRRVSAQRRLAPSVMTEYVIIMRRMQ